MVQLAQQHQRQSHVLCHAQMRQYMESLEHETGLFTTQARQCIVAELAKVLAIEQDLALVPVVQPRHAIEQGRFADTRLADDGHKFPCRQPQRNMTEHGYIAIPLAKVLDDQAHARPSNHCCARVRTCACASAASQATTRRWRILRSQVI
jgi:hypothetical protein